MNSRELASADVRWPGPRLVRVALPMVAIASLVMFGGAIVWSGVATGTIGFDFLAYHQAADRLVRGEALYDPALQILHASSRADVGAIVPFLYPPPFALALVPLTLLPPMAAIWVWLGVSVLALVSAIVLIPVSPTIRWVTLLLAGLSWPVAYSLKLGQVGPILLLLFTVGWRWLDRPAAIATSGGLGAVIKIQPVLLLAWAVLAGRWRAAVLGVGAILGAGLAFTLVAGDTSDWGDYVTMLRSVGDPVLVPNNLSPGAVAYRALGGRADLAAALQLVSSAAALLVALVATLRASPSASFMTAVIASQLISPVLWDHYALVLLLPTAWLLERGYRWASAVPLATSVPLLFVAPSATYPLVFWVTLIAVLIAGIRERDERDAGPIRTAATA
jgi:hypothetical protein